MKIIGITGGIGSGKSTVLNHLAQVYHAYIVETDVLAHKLMSPGFDPYNDVVEAFGKEILLDDGNIDRKKLGAIVFSDEEKLQVLNGIVHPAVKEYIIRDIEQQRNLGIEYYVIEAALLIEDGYKAICDELWYIYTEKEIRINRLIEGRGATREKWEQIIQNQSDDSYYFENCDVIIDNGKNVGELANVVKELLSHP